MRPVYTILAGVTLRGAIPEGVDRSKTVELKFYRNRKYYSDCWESNTSILERVHVWVTKLMHNGYSEVLILDAKGNTV